MTSDDPLPLKEAAKTFPGRTPRCSTLVRWAVKGVSTPAGRVRLAAVVVGGRWFVSVNAVNDFIAATTAARLGEAAPTVRANRIARRRELDSVLGRA